MNKEMGEMFLEEVIKDFGVGPEIDLEWLTAFHKKIYNPNQTKLSAKFPDGVKEVSEIVISEEDAKKLDKNKNWKKI